MVRFEPGFVSYSFIPHSLAHKCETRRRLWYSFGDDLDLDSIPYRILPRQPYQHRRVSCGGAESGTIGREHPLSKTSHPFTNILASELLPTTWLWHVTPELVLPDFSWSVAEVSLGFRSLPVSQPPCFPRPERRCATSLFSSREASFPKAVDR